MFEEKLSIMLHLNSYIIYETSERLKHHDHRETDGKQKAMHGCVLLN